MAVMGVYRITLPPVLAAEPLAEAIPLTVLHVDDDLIVIDNRMAMTGANRKVLAAGPFVYQVP